MTDDVKAALERRRANPGWRGMYYPYPAAVDDAIILADAYLAEHPADDGEPVTADWMRSFAPNPGLYFPLNDDESGVWFVFNPEGCYMAISDGVNRSAELPVPPTRGHVRRLCAALGVELKEGR